MTGENEEAIKAIKEIKYEKDTYDNLIIAITEYAEARGREEKHSKFEAVQSRIIEYRDYLLKK